MIEILLARRRYLLYLPKQLIMTDFDNYLIDIDEDVVLQDYDEADEYQHQLEEQEKEDTDIKFE